MRIDYYALRKSLRLDQFPDDMVQDVGGEAEAKLLDGIPVDSNELAWFLEAVDRARPKVRTVTVTDATSIKELTA